MGQGQITERARMVSADLGYKSLIGRLKARGGCLWLVSHVFFNSTNLAPSLLLSRSPRGVCAVCDLGCFGANFQAPKVDPPTRNGIPLSDASTSPHISENIMGPMEPHVMIPACWPLIQRLAHQPLRSVRHLPSDSSSAFPRAS